MFTFWIYPCNAIEIHQKQALMYQKYIRHDPPLCINLILIFNSIKYLEPNNTYSKYCSNPKKIMTVIVWTTQKVTDRTNTLTVWIQWTPRLHCGGMNRMTTKIQKSIIIIPLPSTYLVKLVTWDTASPSTLVDNVHRWELVRVKSTISYWNTTYSAALI